jgi:DNA repair exonuclease SbcCD ATPase subunit
MADARKGFSEVAEKVFQFPLNHYEIEATQLLNLEAPETELETLKSQRSQARDRMAVLRSKRYQPPLIPVTPLYDFDTAEAKLLELRAGCQNRQARLYDSKAHATWQQRRDAWIHVNPLTTTTLTLKEAEKELRTIVAALAEVEVEGYEPVSERVLKGLEKTHNELTERIQQIGGELRLLQREMADLNRQLTPAVLAEIKAYRQSLKTLQALFGCEPATVTEQMTRAAEIMRKQARNEEQLEDVALNLKELGSVVYNAACKACIANPYRLKKDNLLASEAALKVTAAELEDALSGCFPDTTTDDFDELEAAYKDYQQRSTDRVKTSSNQQTRLKAVRLQIEQLEAEKAAASEQLEENDYEGQATANEYFRLKTNLQLATTVAEAARYSEEEQEWESAKQQQQLDQKIQEAEKQASAAYAAETRQLENDLRTAETEIAIHETVARASTRLAEIAAIRKAFPHWQTYSQLDAKLRPLQAEIAATTASLAQAALLRDKLAETQNTAQQIAIYRKYLSDRTALIETMATKFKEYSDWLYPNKVKPMLENAVNTVLKAIPLPRPISLVAEWENSVASWYVQDGTSRPPYEKASGAQRFFVSLALRLAFSRMGTSNMVNGQIFLDEGFTACDAETMEHIPGLLRSMLQQMEHLQTIFIVSHLDTLKSAASTQIRIHRGAQNSSLMVGDRVQTVKPTKQNAKVLGEDGEIASAPVIPVKKRGRPAKVIQVAE